MVDPARGERRELCRPAGGKRREPSREVRRVSPRYCRLATAPPPENGRGGRAAGRQGGRAAGRQGGRGGRAAGRQGGRAAGRQAGPLRGSLAACRVYALYADRPATASLQPPASSLQPPTASYSLRPLRVCTSARARMQLVCNTLRGESTTQASHPRGRSRQRAVAPTPSCSRWRLAQRRLGPRKE